MEEGPREIAVNWPGRLSLIPGMHHLAEAGRSRPRPLLRPLPAALGWRSQLRPVAPRSGRSCARAAGPAAQWSTATSATGRSGRSAPRPTWGYDGVLHLPSHPASGPNNLTVVPATRRFGTSQFRDRRGGCLSGVERKRTLLPPVARRTDRTHPNAQASGRSDGHHQYS